MTTTSQSNPNYYSLSPISGGQSTSIRTVTLQKRPDNKSFGVYIGEDVPTGLYVVTVERNSPAADCNIQPGDRVLAVNGQPVSSMPKNPKQLLVQAATAAETLTLTVQASHVLDSLDDKYNQNTTTTTTNSSYPNTIHYQPPSERGPQFDNYLETYIKSLFSDPRLHIVPSASQNNNEYVVSSDPYYTSSSSFNLDPYNSLYGISSSYPHHSGDHHHRHHHHRKRAHRETKETQTSDNEFQSENMQQMQPGQYRTQPSMGTTQRILRNRNSSHENELSEHEGHSHHDAKPLPTTTAQVYAAATLPSNNNAVVPPTNHNERPNGTQHMADVVQAAMTASRNQHPPVRVDDTPQQPPSRNTQSSASQQPPPYSTAVEPSSPGKQPANQYNNNAGTYNVRHAQENRPGPPSSSEPRNIPPGIRGNGIREVHLHRIQGFQGYGFHLQYNKIYYLVHAIEPNSPAEQGGLNTDDVIHTINNQMTNAMPHAAFVQIVNQSQEMTFLVQSREEYLRANPEARRTPQASGQQPVAPAPNPGGDSEKPKSGISKALNKLTSR